MRWYCVHPSLPLQAELRIRAAPDSNAAERARISQGRAIAACSPVFYVPGDSIDVDTIAWLQVAYQDVESGNTEGGFVMVALPDGTELVAPWELTDFCGCCEVVDSGTLLFDGPQEMAKTLGSVSGINFLYCIVEENEKRVRIFHPEMESVWIEKKSMQMVCTRLKHEECSTLHTFYELNEALPEEAQIAIREFPSKEAPTVGLLSRGETLEVIVRGGNWLQIAGGIVDKAWVMWRTDALELLQEAPDVCSSTCKTIEKSTADTVNDWSIADQAGWGDAKVEPSSPSQIVDETTSTSPVAPGIDEVAAREIDNESDVATAASTESVHVTLAAAAFPASSTTEEDAINTQSGELSSGWNNRSIRPATTAFNGTDDVVSVGDTLVAAAVDDDATTTASGFALHNTADDVEHGQVRQAWDDRPIRPATSKSTIAEPDSSVGGTDNCDSVDMGDWQHETQEIDSDSDVIANWVESERVHTVPDHDTESDSAVPQQYAHSEPTAIDKGGEADFVQTTPDHDSDVNSSAIIKGEEAKSVQTTPDHDEEIDPTAVIDDIEETKFVQAISDQDADIDPAVVVDARDVEFVNAATNYNVNSESAAVDDVEKAKLVQTTPDEDTGGSSPIVNAEEMGRVKPATDHDVDIGSAVIDDTGDVEFVKTAPDHDAGINFSVIDDAVEVGLALNHDTDIDSPAVNDAAEIVYVKCTPVHDPDIESEEGELVEAVHASDNDADGESAVIDGVGIVEAVPASDNDADGESVIIDGVEILETARTPGDDANSESTVIDSAEEAVPVQTTPDLAAESDFNGKDDSNAVTLAKTAPAEEVGFVHTASSWGNRPRLAEGVPNGNDARGKLRDAAGAGVNLREMDDDTRTFPQHHTANDHVSALDESSRAGLPKAQDRHCQQQLNALTAFETRYAESETTSGSENGEIALLGALEDVFDPVDELLPAMEEAAEEVGGGNPGSPSLTRKEIPLSNDDNLIEEKGGRCDCSGVLHSACRPAQEKTVAGNDRQPDGIAFLERFGTVKYCEQKQLIYPVSDKLSLAMFNADQDDADLVFEVLVGDDPLSDDWFHDIASRKILENLSAAVSNGYAQMRPLSFSKGGSLLDTDSKDTYALIMGGAAPEVILESELLDDDDGNYDLVSSFRYPLPKRRIERRGSNSSLKFQHSAPLCEDASANATTSPIRTVVSATTPPASPQWAPPQTATSSNSKLVHRNSIGAPNISAKPPGALVRPRSFAQTPATSRTTSAASTPSRLAQPAPAFSGVASSKPPGSLLQRRSFLPTPSPPKVSNTSTRIDSIPKASESSGLPIPRKSFGFRRTSSLQKK